MTENERKLCMALRALADIALVDDALRTHAEERAQLAEERAEAAREHFYCVDGPIPEGGE